MNDLAPEQIVPTVLAIDNLCPFDTRTLQDMQSFLLWIMASAGAATNTKMVGDHDLCVSRSHSYLFEFHFLCVTIYIVYLYSR